MKTKKGSCMTGKRNRGPCRVSTGEGMLFPDLGDTDSEKSAYDPLPSVWYGDDAELLERMLTFYPRKPPQDILDATVNAGRFWRGTRRKIVGMDVDPKHQPDVLADNCDMP